MTNLLLVDSRVLDKETVTNSLSNYTNYIIIDFNTDNLQSIKDKINNFNKKFINIGLFQENNNMPFYEFTKSFQRSILNNVKTPIELDPMNKFIIL